MAILDMSHSNILDMSNPEGSMISYDPTASGLTGDTLQEAIDELADEKADLTQGLRAPYLYTDFLVATNSAAVDPFVGTAIATGTINQPNVVDGDHPGVIRMLSSVNANSGYFIGTNTGQFRLAGGEFIEAIFHIDALAGSTTRIGFMDSAAITDPTDGVYLEIAPTTGVATGKSMSNGSGTNSSTTTTLTEATWYRARVQLNADASSATFQVLNMAGTVLWTGTVSATIPTAAGRETGAGFIITNSGTSAITLAHLDMMMIGVDRQLVRGA